MTSGVANVDPNVWRSFVERVVASWSGYQLNIDYNSGPETQERHKWLIDILAEHVYVTRSLKADEFEEWITQIFYNDFDLVLDDDSIYPTCCLLLEAFGYLKNGNQERLAQLTATLPTPEAVQQAKNQSQRDRVAEAEDADVDMDEYRERMSDEDDENEEMRENGGDESSQRERQPRTVTDDDGWTTILRR